MQVPTSSVTDARRSGTRIVALGIAAIVLILAGAATVLVLTLPDANAFNARVERLFIENADLQSQAEVKLLEILAQSGTAFSDTLSSYRLVIFVLLVPEEATQAHLNLLAALARSFSNPDLRNRVRQTHDSEKLKQLLLSGEAA